MRRAFALAALLLLAAGCGGSASAPHLARSDVAPLVSLAGRISHEGACAQAHDVDRLQRRALVLVQAHRVPDALEEQFMSGVNALVAERPTCVPAVAPLPATTTTAPAPPAAPPAGPPGEGHGHGHGPRPGHGHGHGGGHGHGKGHAQ